MSKYALFTCDTEFTPPWTRGTWEDPERESFVEGVEILEALLAERGLRGTFYCQALLVKEFPWIARRLATRHLVGSHGYNHENYGCKPVNVWTRGQPVFVRDKEKKRELLRCCVAIHEEVLGTRPETFVAPFNSVDHDLLDILESLGFKTDQSVDNYHLGLATRPYRPLGFSLTEIPLSVVRFPGERYKNALEAVTFAPSMIVDVLAMDMVSITCHPYEFFDVDKPHPDETLIVGQRKIQALSRLLDSLLEEGYVFTTPLLLADTPE